MIDLLIQLREIVLSRTTRATSVVFSGKAFSSALAIVFTFIAARALGPENWGIVAVLASFITILFAIGELGIGSALFRFVADKWTKKDFAEADRMLGALFGLRVLTGVVLFLLLLLSSRFLSLLVFKSTDPFLTILAAIGLFGFLLMDFQVVQSEAKQNWKLAAAFMSLTNLFRLVLLFFLILQDAVNLPNILFIFAVSPLFAWIASSFWQRTPLKISQEWKRVVKKVIPFSSWMGANRVASSVNSRVDVILLLQLAGAYEAGIYSAASTLALGIPLLIGSYATVLAARYASLKGKALFEYFRKTIGLSAGILVGLVFGIAVAPFIIALFGPEYIPSTRVLQALLAAYIPFVLSAPAVNVLIYAFGKPRIIALVSVLQLPVILSLNWYLIPRIGVFAPVVALVFSNTLMFFASYLFAWREFRK